uniref:Probable pectate lyase F n=1 Tax=Meloidogyne javanica TaxID=6303 RepID=A0A915NEB6_MELJA
MPFLKITFFTLLLSLLGTNIFGFGPCDRMKCENRVLNDTLFVDKDYDCKYTRLIPNRNKIGYGGKDEHQKPVVQISNGATLSNCIIGARKKYKAADGIHCVGNCKIKNVFHEKVGEDAITLLGTDPDSQYIIDGGGAQNAGGKVVQFDGAGNLTIRNFYMKNVYAGIASCGNCLKQYRNRKINVENLTVENLTKGQFIVGVNGNYGDKATLKNITIKGKSKRQVYPCKIFKGNNQGKESPVTSMNPDKEHCILTDKLHISADDTKK